MMETRPTAVDPMTSTQFSPSQLAELDQLQVLLEEPEPHTKLGQQVRRLEQKGLHKSAGYVKTCGRLVEKWTYACGRSYPETSSVPTSDSAASCVTSTLPLDYSRSTAPIANVFSLLERCT